MNRTWLIALVWGGCLAGVRAQPGSPEVINWLEAVQPTFVRGVVTDAAGPVAEVRVTLFDGAVTYFRETRTSATGQYALNNVRPGTWQLGIAARGYDYEEISVVVSGGRIVRDFELQPESIAGEWNIIGSTAPEFLDATDIGVLLADGRIFYCHDTIGPILFDPQTGLNSFPAGSGFAGGCMNGTLLAGGRVLFAGGQEGDDPGDFRLAVRWVRTFDPLIEDWTLLADLQHPTGRWYPGLARLNDGSLLAMGGGTRPNAARTATCELFELVTETWAYTGSMLNPTEFPPCALLYTGEVLATWYPPQLYNPANETWRATGNFVQPNRQWPGHSDHSLIMLTDGRAIALGTIGHTNNFMGEIYDPAVETWSVTSNPGLLRFQSEVVQLPDGRILVAGGESKEPNPPVPNILNIVKWCDLYDPAANAWRRVADMNWFREYHAVTLFLPDGRVAMTGGTRIKFQYGPTSADIEGFAPPYLFRGVRPQVTNISGSEATRGQTVTLSIFPNTRLTSVVLMGMQTTTHWVDGGIPRRLVLPVQQAGQNATIQLPSDPNVLPLGYYMVFAMVDDIPSVARTLLVQE